MQAACHVDSHDRVAQRFDQPGQRRRTAPGCPRPDPDQEGPVGAQYIATIECGRAFYPSQRPDSGQPIGDRIRLRTS